MATKLRPDLTGGLLGLEGDYIIFGGGRIFGFYDGVPVSGTTLAGEAAPGSVLVDYTNFDIYMNTNTLASPTWTKKVD